MTSSCVCARISSLFPAAFLRQTLSQALFWPAFVFLCLTFNGEGIYCIPLRSRRRNVLGLMQPDSICDIMLIWVWEAKDNIWHNGASLISLISNSNGKEMTTFPKHSSCLSLVSQKNSSALNSRDWMSQMSLKHCVTLNTVFKLITKKNKNHFYLVLNPGTFF